MAALRRLLLISVCVLFTGQVFMFFAPYFYPTSDMIVNEAGGHVMLLIQRLSSFVVFLPLPVILLWAAHNLKPISFLSTSFLLVLIKTTIGLVAFAVAVEGFLYIKELLPYFPEGHSVPIRSLVDGINWFLYSVGELVMLGFAAFQTRQRIREQVLSEDVT